MYTRDIFDSLKTLNKLFQYLKPHHHPIKRQIPEPLFKAIIVQYIHINDKDQKLACILYYKLQFAKYFQRIFQDLIIIRHIRSHSIR